jgi:hypothetical protein
MTSLLEERYRAVLRMLPRDFRRDWGDDMVATFLDQAYRSRPDDPEGVDISAPRWTEVASVARLAVRLRLGRDAGAREYVTGDALRRYALAGALAHVTLGLSGVLLAVWWTARLTGSETGFTSWWAALAALADLLWIPAFVSLLSGRARFAAGLAVLGLIPGTAIMLSREPGAFAAAWLLLSVSPVVAMVAFHRGAAPVRPRAWVIAVPVLTAGLTAAVALAPRQISVIDLVAGGIVLAGGGVLIATRGRPAVAVAVALGCLLALPLRLTHPYGVAATVELAALLLTGSAAATVAGHGRRMGARAQGWDSADASA